MAKCERHIWDTEDEDNEYCFQCEEATQQELLAKLPERDTPDKLLARELKKWNDTNQLRPYFENEDDDDWYNNLDNYHNDGGFKF